jgi:hypothetical protein
VDFQKEREGQTEDTSTEVDVMLVGGWQWW